MTDRYTKIVLTIIAVCLVWISVRDTAPSAYAQGTMDVNIVEVAGETLFCSALSLCPGLNAGIPVHVTN